MHTSSIYEILFILTCSVYRVMSTKGEGQVPSSLTLERKEDMPLILQSPI